MRSQTIVVPIGGTLDWRDFQIPGGSVSVRLAQLRFEDSTRATTSLVRFPDAWRRPGPGWYSTAEEFVVLEGELSMNGTTYRAADWVYVPAGTTRRDTIAHGDVLAFARFSGPAKWHEGEGEEHHILVASLFKDQGDAGPSPLGAGTARLLFRREGISSWVAEPPAHHAPAPHDVEMMGLYDGVWAWVPAGEPFPSLEGRCFCRTFSAGE